MGAPVIKGQINIQQEMGLMGNSKELLMGKKAHTRVMKIQKNLTTKIKADQILHLQDREKIQLIEYLEREAEAKGLEGKDLHSNHQVDTQ